MWISHLFTYIYTATSAPDRTIDLRRAVTCWIRSRYLYSHPEGDSVQRTAPNNFVRTLREKTMLLKI